ncbi:MAG: sigma-70 family RNA polymerase sigma factor [Planctomycetota bacterium]
MSVPDRADEPFATMPASAAALVRDRALIDRWRGGEAAAGVELLDHYVAYVRRIALRHGVRPGSEFEEFWQELVLRLLQQLPTLPDRLRTSFAGYLAWQVRDLMRTWRRNSRPLALVDVDQASDPVEAPGVRSAFWAAVRDCSEQLPPREHSVFEHRFLGGFDLGEVATRVGSNANAVAQAVFRLVRRLRDCLSAKGFTGPGDLT